MKIQKLILINFQRHKKLELDLEDDINVISGLTGTGKTCVFRALEWVCNFSNISADDFRKEGTKETSVKIILDNGFGVERVRSNSINRYILSKEGDSDIVFDSFGKETPEEITNALGISQIVIDNEKLNLNFASQDQLNFILDSTYSDTFKAKLFNKLTGNEMLDDVFKKLNKEHLRISKETKQTEKDIETQEEQLGDYSVRYKEDKKKLNLIKDRYEQLLEKIEVYNHLLKLEAKLKTNKDSIEFLKFKKSQIKDISVDKLNELKEKAKLLNRYQNLFADLESNKSVIKKLNVKKESLAVTDVDFNLLKKNSETLLKLKHIQKRFVKNTEQIESVTKQIAKEKELLDNQETELKELWDACSVCPLCKGKVNHK